ncbi:hypothetical protein JHJ32_07460 [Parapedobacter sp. ISTM3]|uniref:hypothetical protein n=1 Tax=Parapedobacter sp. ISTM3 TaxID=2800130 RepID=UPI001908F2CE|nr:hypothetical protein [Parapedobacter sp. ISTM3]MBK1439815.1 hypothetical protein [Parapedobacter sp. ISTM3]
MRGELTKLTKFLEIYGRCDPADGKIQPNDGQSVNVLFDKLLSKLEQRIADSASNEALAIFIRQTQLGFTTRADACHAALLECSKRGNQIVEMLSEIHRKITYVLQYLHDNHADHFDHSLPVPIGLRQDLATVDGAAELRNRLKEVRADNRLIKLLTGLLLDDKNGDPEGSTWAYFDYRTKLIGQVNSTISYHREGTDATVPIIEALVSCNVNNIGFYRYMLSYIDQIIDSNATYEEKEEELETLLRKMERVRVSPKMAYHSKTGHIRDSIKGCIMYELDRIKRAKKSTSQHWGNAKNNGREHFYFNIAATIQELLLLAWLMIEVGFIKSKNHSRLYVFIRNHIRTERTDNPSTGYMRNKFGPNNVAPKTVRIMRAWLMLMVKRLDTLAAAQKIE